MKATAIGTVTLARNDREAALLGHALKTLSRIGLPIFAADGGSVDSFMEQTRGISCLELWEEGATLVPQIKACFRRILRTDHRVVLYTEPDKRGFFESGVRDFLRSAESSNTAAILIAARDAQSLATFPAGQRIAEQAFNDLAKHLLDIDADLLYGPLLLDLTIAGPYLEQVPDSLGWGWRPYLIGRCILAGEHVNAVTGAFCCPLEQQAENGKDLRYRLVQLQQNVEGLRLALEHSQAADKLAGVK